MNVSEGAQTLFLPVFFVVLFARRKEGRNGGREGGEGVS